MAKKMKPVVKLALTAGAIFGAVSLFRNEKVRKWSKENATKLRDSSLGANVAELTDWSRDRIYELRDPHSKTARLVKVLPAGNYIQRALEVILPEARDKAEQLEGAARRAGRKAEAIGDKAKEVAERAGEGARDIAERAGEGARDFADRVGARAKDMGQSASDGMNTAAEYVSEQASDAAERVDGTNKKSGEFIATDSSRNSKERERVKSAS